MHASLQPATKCMLNLLPRLGSASVIALILLSGCDTDTRDVHDVGSENSRPYSSIVSETDIDIVVDENTIQSTASAIEYDGEMLSVSLDAVPLLQVATEISRQTGIEIQFIGEHPASTVTIQFSDSPVEPGLRRLLRNTNTLFVYADRPTGGNQASQLAKVMILPSGQSRDVNESSSSLADASAGLSERIRNAIPLTYPDANVRVSTNDTLTDLAIHELTETLGKRISELRQIGGFNVKPFP